MVASTLGLALAIGCKCIRALSLCSGCLCPQLSSSTRWQQTQQMDLLDMSDISDIWKIPWTNAVFRTQEQAHAEVLWAWILFWDGADIDIHKDPVAYIWRLTARKTASSECNVISVMFEHVPPCCGWTILPSGPLPLEFIQTKQYHLFSDPADPCSKCFTPTNLQTWTHSTILLATCDTDSHRSISSYWSMRHWTVYLGLRSWDASNASLINIWNLSLTHFIHALDMEKSHVWVSDVRPCEFYRST